jgi:hypothetical protein
MRKRAVRYAVIGAALLAVSAAGLAVWLFFQAVAGRQEEAYAVWQTADLVIDHMKRHKSAWPRGWDDLLPPAAGTGASVAERGGVVEVGFRPPADIGRLQELVEVDWSADPRELARAAEGAGSPPFRVIWLKSGRRTAFEGCEPNQLILDYLKGRYRVRRP